MAEIKRKFYNSGDAKGFTKAIFFETVRAMAAGEDVEDNMVALVEAAANYELEGIANRASTKPSGEKKNPLESDYAKALAAAIVPLIGSEPQTAQELIDQATARGQIAPSGKPFSGPWVSRVLNAMPEQVVVTRKVVTRKDAKGLTSQTEVNAYVKA